MLILSLFLNVSDVCVEGKGRSSIFYFNVCTVYYPEQKNAQHIYIQGVPGGNVSDFGRMFLKLIYTFITQKNLYPKLNGYGDNGEIKVLSSCGSTYSTWFE